MNDNVKAYEYLLGRGATRLCHFTKVQSLTHILLSEDGILATAFISGDIIQQNDMARLDNQTDYVSCSLQYPNCWYWEEAKNRDNDIIFSEWVVLTIDLEILKSIKYKFCSCNAARNCGIYISDDLCKIPDLYGNPNMLGRYRKLSMLSCCPTDDQAEIIVYKNIPISYINGVIVGNNDSAKHIAAILKTVGRKIPIYVSADVCNKNWSNMVRRGVKPFETEYTY